jgi:hypothetical protein
MRTKTLLITAAIGAAAAVATQAQVYSVNAVGYINLTAKPGFNLLANQLIPADAGLLALLPGVPDGTTVYTFNPATGYLIATWDELFGEWGGDADQTLDPGKGFWLRVPGTDDLTITLVGEVPQGTLNVELSEGFNLVSSMVPQAGEVVGDLGMPVADGETVYTYAPDAGYTITTWDELFGEWDNGVPTVGVGEGFWVRKAGDASWTRDFSVNQ